MATRTPLAQNPSSRMNDIHKMRIRLVQISRIIRSGIEEDRRVQSRDPAQLALLRLKVIRYQSGYMRSHTVPNEMDVIRLHSSWMSRQILDQLGDAQTAEARRPLHLAETGLFDGTSVVYDDDVVVASLEIGLTDIRTGRQVASAAESVNNDLGGMGAVEVAVVQGFGIEHVHQFGQILGSPCVKEELDSRMRTSVWLFQAGAGCEDVGGGWFLGSLSG